MHKHLSNKQNNTTIEPTAFVTVKRHYQDRERPSKGQSNNSRKNFFCDHCKTSGHTISRRYKLHGYPTRNKRIAAIACNENDTDASHVGHSEDQFNKLMSLVCAQRQDHPSYDQHHAKLVSSSILAAKFCLLSNNHTNSIIDSGASDYISNNIENFLNVKRCHLSKSCYHYT